MKRRNINIMSANKAFEMRLEKLGSNHELKRQSDNVIMVIFMSVRQLLPLQDNYEENG